MEIEKTITTIKKEEASALAKNKK